MADIRVIIDGKLADLPPQGLSLPLTYSLRSREGLTINTGSRSEYAFELPATKQNSDIFNMFYEVGGITIVAQSFMDASIEVDGQPFFIGKCQLQSVTLRPDLYGWGGKTYKVAFYGNNSDWAIRLKNTFLYQLGFGTHLYERDQILVYWDYTYLNDYFKYILIKWKNWNVFGEVDTLESTPALFIVHVLDRIFNSIGYTVNSDFIRSDWFSKLVMPIPIGDRINDPQYAVEYLNVEVKDTIIDPNGNYWPVVFTTQTVAPTVGANPYDNMTGFYTAPVTGFYLFNFTIEVVSTAGVWQAEGGLVQNGSFPVIVGATYFFLPFGSSGNYLLTIESDVIFLNAGEFIGLKLSAACTDPSTYFNISMSVTGEAEIIDNINLDFKYLINKRWSALDFIRGLAHAFNLVFETNEGQKIVSIEPADKYLLEDRYPNTRVFKDGFYVNTEEKTEYVDLIKGGELVSDTKQDSAITLTWKPDSSDPTVEAMNENQSIGLLNAKYNFKTDRFGNDEAVIENPFFAPTVTIIDKEIIATGSVKEPIIPIIWAENYLEVSSSTEKVIDVLPRILITERLNSAFNGLINVRLSGGLSIQQTPMAYMVDYNDTEGYQTSLSFSDESVNQFTISGLMKRFYLSELVRLENGKKLEIFMLWDVLMLQNLTFRNKLIINSDTFILQEINAFNVSKNASTKTFLLHDYKEVNAEDRIQNTQTQSKVAL
jgi:hypothetical protein